MASQYPLGYMSDGPGISSGEMKNEQVTSNNSDNEMELGRDGGFKNRVHLVETDQRDMMRLGRDQELNRNFRFISILGFSTILMETWETTLTASMFGLIDGGTGGIIWTYVGIFIGFVFVYATMAEMASMAPTSGGQYHWVSEFAPRSSQKFLSYITGWICVMGWQTGIASIAFLAGTQIQGLIVLNNPNYDFQRWHGTLLCIAVTLFAILFNTVLAKKLPFVEGLVLFLHIFGFFAILIPLWVLSPRTTADVVFTTFSDGGGWGNVGLACLVGMLSPVFSLLGSDAATHMAEEVEDSSWVLPRSMMWSLWLNGLLGLVMLVTFCFCLTDLETMLGTPTGYPYIQVFFNATNSYAGTSIMTTVVIMLTVCGCISNVATASRQMWAFARDQGLPCSGFLAEVRPGLNVPVNAVLISLCISILLFLINIGSAVAFNAIASLGVASLLSSYIISFTCLIIKRVRHEPLPVARWSLGRYGLWINCVALAFLIVIWFFSFWPLADQVDPTTMNWNVGIYGAALIFAVGYYFVWGKLKYDGPVARVKIL